MANPKKLTIYPHDSAWRVLGPASTPTANQAVECWAEAVRRGAAVAAAALKRLEWMALADVLNGTMFDTGWSGDRLAQEVEDGHRLDGLGVKWFAPKIAKRELAQVRANKAIADLCAKLRALGYAEAWAVILAIRYFWDHHESIDAHADEWWTLPYRLGKAEAAE